MGYFAFCTMMGLMHMPKICIYWSKEPTFHHSPIADKRPGLSKGLIFNGLGCSTGLGHCYNATRLKGKSKRGFVLALPEVAGVSIQRGLDNTPDVSKKGWLE